MLNYQKRFRKKSRAGFGERKITVANNKYIQYNVVNSDKIGYLSFY